MRRGVTASGSISCRAAEWNLDESLATLASKETQCARCRGHEETWLWDGSCWQAVKLDYVCLSPQTFL